jgi:uncharacterized protein
VTAVFLDTVGVLAIWDRADQWHAAASRVFDDLVRSRSPLVTTSLVFLECGNAAARTPFRGQVDVLRRAFVAEGRCIEPTAGDLELAWTVYNRGEAGGAGIVDHVSFLVMRRLGLTRAFTHDAHSRAAGFETLF